jgi:hypothetical protein
VRRHSFVKRDRDQARESARARARSGERGKLLDELKIILGAHLKARLAALG